jgi:hypothetical protein
VIVTTGSLRGGHWAAKIDPIVAVLVSLVSLVALVSTSSHYGMAWDEGHTVRRERTLASWFQSLISPPPDRSHLAAFSESSLSRHWPFSREEPDGHPPFYAMIGLAGWYVSHTYLAPLTAYRLGPMVLTAVTLGILYLHLVRRHGNLVALTSAGSLLLMPRVFSHSHYAHYDMPMSCLWVLAQIAFLNSLRSRAWIPAFGAVVGLAAATKFTGWFAPLAAIGWTVVFEGVPRIRAWWRGTRIEPVADRVDLGGTQALVFGLCLAAAVVYAIQPAWWFAPLRGVATFLESNLTRADSKPIPSLYLGHVYPFSLPWHNTLVITLATVPVFVLLLGAAGIVSVIVRRRSDPDSVIWLFSWLVLMVVRALPSAPGHDVERQFLPSFLSFAVLAGLGGGWLAQLFDRYRFGWLVRLIPVIALCESAIGIIQLYPYTLSYYNAAVGGLRGAQRLGFELTYYWDTMGPDFADWVRDRSAEKAVELRFPSDLINIRFLREWGELPDDVPIVGIEHTNEPYYVLQRRRGCYFPYDWWLDRHGASSFVVSRQGVDLLRVYSYSESYRAFQATADEPIPEYLRN